MPRSVANAAVSEPRELPEKADKMASAPLRYQENRDYQAEIGACLFRSRSWLGWSLKELAAKLGRDERQIGRWEKGEENVQLHVVFSIEELREPFCVQLAKLSGADVHIHVAFKRTA